MSYFVCEPRSDTFIRWKIESNAFYLPWNGKVQRVVNKDNDRLYIPHQQGI